MDAGWDDIQEHVDAAIVALPTELREAVVAHYIGRKTHGGVAAELGITRRAVSYRIERGVAAIRKELARSGVVLSAAALASLFAAESSAAPLSLKATLGKLAIAAGPAPAGGGATAGGSLLGSLLLMKSKAFVAIGFLVLVATGIFFVLTREVDEPPVEVGETETVAPPEEPALESLPMPVVASDDEDQSTIEEDSAPTLEELLALSRAELERALENYPPIADPDQHASVSGLVLDQDGYPISGAAISLVPTQHWGRLPGAGEMARTAVSAADGAYHIDGIENGGFFWVSAARAGYATLARGTSKEGPLNVEPGMKATVDFTLEAGLTLRGRVLTAAGVPVPEALVQCVGISGPSTGGFDGGRGGRTGPDGHFTLGFPEEERGFVTSVRVQSARHGGATFPSVWIQDDHPVELKLSAPSIIQGTVKNSDGEVVPGARMNFFASTAIEFAADDGGSGRRTVFGGHFIGVSDSHGQFATEVDAGLDFEVEIRVAGYHVGEKRDEISELEAGETREYNPVLDANAITVSAEIVGQQSGEPVRSYLPVNAIAMRDGKPVGYSIPGSPSAIHIALPPEPGEYTFQARYMYDSNLSGDLSKPYDLEPGDEIDIELNVPDPQSFTVRALDPNGRPVAGAWVHFTSESWGDSHTPYQTNNDGRLDAPIVIAPEIGARFYLTATGYAPAWGLVYEDQSPGTVHPEETFVLWPGAGLEGDVVDGEGEALSNEALTVGVSNNTGQAWTFEVSTDGAGHFTIVDQVPADTVDVVISAADGDGAWSSEQQRLEANAITGLGRISLK